MSVRLSEIAELAGCSVTTVSRTLNGTAAVHEGTSARARSAIASLESGTPAGNAPVRRQRGRPRGSIAKSNLVDVVLFRRERIEPLSFSRNGLSIGPAVEARPDTFFNAKNRLSSDFHRHIVEGTVSRLGEHGLRAIQQVRRELDDESFLAEVNGARHRGLLLMGDAGVDVARFCERCVRPLVLVDILGVAARPVVSIDNHGGMHRGIRHLIDLGHRRIGFVGRSDNPSFRERLNGFYGEMGEAGLVVRPEWVHDIAPDGYMEAVAHEMALALARRERPSAVVCCSDFAAIGVLRAATAANLRVPLDLSVVGFDDIDAAALVPPGLTTLHVPTVQLGVCAVDLLLQCESAGAGSPWLASTVRCRTTLVVRGSTAAPQAAPSSP
jgi:DNA-binding LacI/PurR family transcriptional regulator